MRYRLSKTTSWLLATLYTVFAVFGWGLHALTHYGEMGCGSVCCESDVATPPADACGCCGDCQPALVQLAPPAAPAYQSTSTDQPCHDEHECGICRLLAQMKMGHSELPVGEFSSPIDMAILAEPKASAPSEPFLSHYARGPPVGARV